MIEFPCTSIDPEQIAATALEYIGVPYNEGSTVLLRDSWGRPYGMTNCYGLFLQVAKVLMLLPEDFDVNIPPSKNKGGSRALTLTQIICTNFVRVGKHEMRSGDLIIMQYKDANPHLNEPHHVALCIGEKEMIHAFEQRAGMGAVCRQSINPLIYSRIAQVHRMKNTVDQWDRH